MLTNEKQFPSDHPVMDQIKSAQDGYTALWCVVRTVHPAYNKAMLLVDVPSQVHGESIGTYFARYKDHVLLMAMHHGIDRLPMSDPVNIERFINNAREKEYLMHRYETAKNYDSKKFEEKLIVTTLEQYIDDPSFDYWLQNNGRGPRRSTTTSAVNALLNVITSPSDEDTTSHIHSLVSTSSSSSSDASDIAPQQLWPESPSSVNQVTREINCNVCNTRHEQYQCPTMESKGFSKGDAQKFYFQNRNAANRDHAVRELVALLSDSSSQPELGIHRLSAHEYNRQRRLAAQRGVKDFHKGGDKN